MSSITGIFLTVHDGDKERECFIKKTAEIFVVPPFHLMKDKIEIY